MLDDEIPFKVPPLSWLKIDNLVEDYLLKVCPETLIEACKTDIEKIIDVYLYHTHGVKVIHGANIPKDEEARFSAVTNKIEIPHRTVQMLEQQNPRARFTLAHEAGHVLLHREYILTNAFRLARSTPVKVVKEYEKPEPQANQAAAAILMPKKTIIPEYLRLLRVKQSEALAISALQDVYECSYESVRLRIAWLKKNSLLLGERRL